MITLMAFCQNIGALITIFSPHFIFLFRISPEGNSIIVSKRGDQKKSYLAIILHRVLQQNII